jgi:hypothetical protein
MAVSLPCAQSIAASVQNGNGESLPGKESEPNPSAKAP